jgi:hypothetical protein
MERQCKHGEYYTCKRLKLLQWLLDKGFFPEYDMPDPDNLKYKWWKFKNSPELEDTIEEFFSK